jgi:hypothetical protein
LRKPTASVFRCDIAVPLGSGLVRLKIDGIDASFHVPTASDSSRIAYASCNGFSNPRAMKAIDNKNDRWQDMLATHPLPLRS